MLTAAEIRQKFLDFFEEKGHVIVPSAPIVVKNDPTLMFTNAGMNQFKDYFLGNQTPPYGRVADTQKCLRVSGKHNDLEEVGVDTYHHTMFEMLGNWSFGDYFKHEAISWSWELLTSVYKLPKDRLYATVFEGDEKEGIPASKIALEKWKEYLPMHQIVYGNKKDNFWEMGDTGPCGPCSEIHIDLRTNEEIAAVPGHELVNKDHPQVIEIWNNVFIQYNRKKDGTLEDLPAKHVDTGMGFERLVRAIQGKQSNYDTDVFSGTIAAIENITQLNYDALNKANVLPNAAKGAIAFRVLADHIRAISFTIADGQLPSNTGAGYVIRRILRRAVRYYYSYLNYKQPLLTQLVPVLAAQFELVFPELAAQQDFVAKVVKEEEESFLRTLEKGLKRIDDIITNKANTVISGAAAFELNDTYGFPIDLTKLIAAEHNLQVDEQGYEAERKKQQERGRADAAQDTEDWVVVHDVPSSGFIGYTEHTTTTTIIKYRKVTAKGNTLYQILLQATPCYAESGGQVGDTGTLTSTDGSTILITNTKKENDLIIHYTHSLPTTLDATVTVSINKALRASITEHHTATHLLQAALQQVLGKHVAQKGSLNNAEGLRFDFAHFAKCTTQELQQVEHIVNAKIRANIPVITKVLPKEEAMAMGAMALFGEKYGDTVRVVIIDPNYSIELCGGTHVAHTGELGILKIISETAIAAGVRRIEAVVGCQAELYLLAQLDALQHVRNALNNPKELLVQVHKLQDDNKQLQASLASLEHAMLVAKSKALLTLTTHNNTILAQQVHDELDINQLKKLQAILKTAQPQLSILLLSVHNQKINTVLYLTDEVVNSKPLHASNIVKQTIAPLIQGGGGGNATLATATGTAVHQAQAVINAVLVLLS